MKGKKFIKDDCIAQAVQWDHYEALWICKFSWGEFFYEDDEFIRENLVEG